MSKYLKELIGRSGGYSESTQVNSVLNKMIGSEIINAGFVEGISEGGMAFDFKKNGIVRRVVFGYNELGEWIYFEGNTKKQNKIDSK